MSEREELLKAFWEAANTEDEYVDDLRKDSATSGVEVRLDGWFNIWAGIQAVIGSHDLQNLGSAPDLHMSIRPCDECKGWVSRSFGISSREHHARDCSLYANFDALDAQIEALKAENTALKAALSGVES